MDICPFFIWMCQETAKIPARTASMSAGGFLFPKRLWRPPENQHLFIPKLCLCSSAGSMGNHLRRESFKSRPALRREFSKAPVKSCSKSRSPTRPFTTLTPYTSPHNTRASAGEHWTNYRENPVPFPSESWGTQEERRAGSYLLKGQPCVFEFLLHKEG